MNLLLYLALTLYILKLIRANKNKSPSRFERAYSECKNQDCLAKQFDENCIYKCISETCYDQVYYHYLIEFGEINFDKKNQFERCFNSFRN